MVTKLLSDGSTQRRRQRNSVYEKTGQVDLCSALKDLQKPKNATTILILS